MHTMASCRHGDHKECPAAWLAISACACTCHRKGVRTGSVNEQTRIDLDSGDAIAAAVMGGDDGPRIYVSAFDVDHDTVATLELTASEADVAGQLLQDAASEARDGPPGED